MGQMSKKSLTSVNDVQVFKCLPLHIREELTDQAFRPILTQHPFFNLFRTLEPKGFRRVVCDCLVEIALLPEEPAFRDTEPINKHLFVVAGSLHYRVSGENYVRYADVLAHQWACEEALWSSVPILEGQLTAGMAGCEIIAVLADTFRETCAMSCRETFAFVVQYGQAFMEKFNKACQDESHLDRNIMFNSLQSGRKIVEKAVENFNDRFHASEETFSGRKTILQNSKSTVSFDLPTRPSASGA